jgi:hypothetical protein
MAGSGNIGSWVPQLFYDLIARVVPGFIIIIIIFSLIVDVKKIIEPGSWSFLTDKNFPTTLVILVGYALSYICGFFFRGLYCLITKRDGGDPDFIEGTVEQYDRIKFIDRKAGTRLSKVRAEIHMCTVLKAGLIAALTITWLATTANLSESAIMRAFFPTGIIILLFVAVTGMHRRLKARFNQELKNFTTHEDEILEKRKLLSEQS